MGILSKLLGRPSRVGTVYLGTVVRSSDPLLVRWPGTYAVNADGGIDSSAPVMFDSDLGAWVFADRVPVGSGDSNYLENKLLDGVLGGPAFSLPATVYIALHTADPTDTGSGAEVTTGAWSNYARVAVTNNATNFPAAAAGAKSNGTIIDFGTATIVAPPTVTHAAVWDAATAGNLLKHGALVTSKVINNGDPVSFPVGDLDVTHD